jgi:RND family efflux transporter MFP subunit
MSDASKPRPARSWIRLLISVVACVLILGASVAVMVIINRTEPTARQIEATRKSAALVEAITVQRGAYSPRVVVLGTVEPANEIILSPQVRGQIVEVSPKFVPGGMVRKGDLLLRIDPADFDNAVLSSESELQQVEALLEIEQGRQSLAKKELALLGETIDDANRSLVLREPQINSILAQINGAKADLESAKLDLERTSVKAPFDAQILSRSVNVGSQIAPGDALAELVGIEEYWIMATAPVRSLYWLQFPELDGEGSSVTLRNSDTWPPGAERYAKLSGMIGTLDEQTRLARVLISVKDPLARTTDGPPLILETLVETDIEGRPIENVVRLSRDYVHDGDTVWVIKDDKLQIRKVGIVFRDAQFAYIQDGLDSGEQVVTTNLATVAEGVGLRKVNASAQQSENSSGEAVD